MNQDNNNFELSGTLGSLKNTALENLANDTVINNDNNLNVNNTVPNEQTSEIEMLDVETPVSTPIPVTEPVVETVDTTSSFEETALNNVVNPNIEFNNVVMPNQGLEPIPTNFDIGDIGSVPPVDPTGKKEKKNKKSKLWFVLLLIIFILTVGALVFYYLRVSKGTLSNAVVTNEISLEMGNELSTDINDYATFKTISSSNCILNTKSVDITKVGTYEYSIACGTNTYKGKVIIKDSLAPIVTTKTIVKKLNEVVTPEEFISKCEESSVCSYAFENEEEVTTSLQQSGTYEFNIIISDTSNNTITKTAKLIVMDVDIKVYLNCVLSDQTEEGFDGLVSYIDKIGISSDSKYVGLYFNIKEYVASSEEEYNKIKNDYLNNNILDLNNGNGTPNFDDTNLIITIEEVLSGEADFGDTYSVIRNHYENQNYKCNIMNVN